MTPSVKVYFNATKILSKKKKFWARPCLINNPMPSSSRLTGIVNNKDNIYQNNLTSNQFELHIVDFKIKARILSPYYWLFLNMLFILVVFVILTMSIIYSSMQFVSRVFLLCGLV